MRIKRFISAGLAAILICLPFSFTDVMADDLSVDCAMPTVTITDTGTVPAGTAYKVAMKDDQTSKIEEIEVSSNSKGTFPKKTFTELGIYEYDIYQESGTDTHCQYDGRSYHLAIYVTNETDGIRTASIVTDPNGTKVDSVSFANAWKKYYNVKFSTDGNGYGTYNNSDTKSGTWEIIPGDGFKIKITPNSGYSVLHVWVTDANGNRTDDISKLKDGILDLGELSGDVTVLVQFVKDGSSVGSTPSSSSQAPTDNAGKAKTGDDSDALLYGLLMLASVSCGLACSAASRKKSHK